jgi:radical SAM protein with 4Fe4S-binding SPASM domain
MSDEYRMDSHKLYWHLDRVTEWQEGKRVAPLHIDMGISQGCNIACSYCYGVVQGRTGYGTDEKSIFHMPLEAIQRTFREAKEIGVRSIALIGEGENTLNPSLYDSLQTANDINLDVSLATNGIRINHDHLDTLLTSLKWLRINISAASEESFQLIHRSNQFERVKENVRALVAKKKEKKYDCAIGLQMVVTAENFDQVVPLAKLGQELDVDYFVIKPCSDTPNGDLESPHQEYIDNVSIYEEARGYSNNTYKVIPKIAKLMDGGWKDYKVCFGTQFLMAISADGGVFPCGHWFDIRRDEFFMGNVIDTSFKEIVESERYWEVQRRIQDVDVNMECETNCRQHYINQFLSNISEVPTHKNFI